MVRFSDLSRRDAMRFLECLFGGFDLHQPVMICLVDPNELCVTIFDVLDRHRVPKARAPITRRSGVRRPPPIDDLSQPLIDRIQ